MVTTFELMHDHLRAIYRSLTGGDLPEPTEGQAADQAPASAEDLARRFAELEATARLIPRIVERVPPFSFSPPLDAIDTERELIVELGVPGVERDDVRVAVSEDLLRVAGARPGEHELDGRTYFHAELPRGPFERVLPLPYAVVGDPRVEVVQGIIRVRLTKAVKSPPAMA